MWFRPQWPSPILSQSETRSHELLIQISHIGEFAQDLDNICCFSRPEGGSSMEVERPEHEQAPKWDGSD